MDDFLELLLTILSEVLSNMKYKDPRKRTWVMTGFFSLLSLLLEGFMVWTAVDFYKDGNMAGAITFTVIAIGVLTAALIIIIRGHRRNWDHY